MKTLSHFIISFLHQHPSSHTDWQVKVVPQTPCKSLAMTFTFKHDGCCWPLLQSTRHIYNQKCSLHSTFYSPPNQNRNLLFLCTLILFLKPCITGCDLLQSNLKITVINNTCFFIHQGFMSSVCFSTDITHTWQNSKADVEILSYND